MYTKSDISFLANDANISKSEGTYVENMQKKESSKHAAERG